MFDGYWSTRKRAIEMTKDAMVQICWQEMKPLCDAVIKQAGHAPLSNQHHAGLLVMMACHFYGAAIAAAARSSTDGAPQALIARQIADVLVEGVGKNEMN
jgi:hypothetical protein